MARLSKYVERILRSPDLRLLSLMVVGASVFGFVDGSAWRSLLSPTIAYRPAVLFGFTLVFAWRGLLWSQLIFLMSFAAFLGWRGVIFVEPLYLVSSTCALVTVRRLAGTGPWLSQERSTLAFLAGAILAPAVPALLNDPMLRAVGIVVRPGVPGPVETWLRAGTGILALVPAMLVLCPGRLSRWVGLPPEREWQVSVRARDILELGVEAALWAATLWATVHFKARYSLNVTYLTFLPPLAFALFRGLRLAAVALAANAVIATTLWSLLHWASVLSVGDLRLLIAINCVTILVLATVVDERQRGRAQVEDQDRQLSTIYESVSDALFLLSVEAEDRYCFVTVNRTFLQLTGLTESQVRGKYLHEVIPARSLPVVLENYRRAISGKANVRWEEVSEYPAGTKCGGVSITPLFDENSRCTNVVGTVRDLTERRQSTLERARLEDQLRQAQKMESIGRLAGGVAHDFNNLLTIINGYIEFLKNALSQDDPLREYAVLISDAGERAANLTKQLLTFSRRQVIQPRPFDLNAAVRETEGMLRSLLGEDISLVIRFDPHALRVLADPDQIHQVLMNLVANARDAMPRGGRLIIVTTEAAVDEKYVRSHPDAREGRSVLITVIDTGCGMDEATRQNIFEPFFTTKERGRGTGLGLATVYGIVRQLNGWIDVESELGLGSTFKIYLPCMEENYPVEENAPSHTSVQPGSETILLVEDEKDVLGFAKTALTSNGYQVIDAANGIEAIGLSARYPSVIHLLVSDVVMPGMDGRELADLLTVQRPAMKVLFMSGYTANVIVQRGVVDNVNGILAKPFSQAGLTAKVREVLAGTARTS